MDIVHIKELDENNKLVNGFQMDLSDLDMIDDVLDGSEYTHRDVVELIADWPTKQQPFINMMVNELQSSFRELFDEVDSLVLTDTNTNHTFVCGIDEKITMKQLMRFCA